MADAGTMRERRRPRGIAVVACALALWNGSAVGDPRPWPDTPVGRLQATALIATLDADLLGHDSATLTLDRWCAAHRLADPPVIVADRVIGADKPASAEVRGDLAVAAGEPIRYRRVRLRCGRLILSDADNWYVPRRLTPAMNQALGTSDTPFGRAVRALHFSRHTLSAEMLWRPLPQGWETGTPMPRSEGSGLAIPNEVLRHRAVLTLPDGTPFSEVVETDTGAVLRFAPPDLPR